MLLVVPSSFTSPLDIESKKAATNCSTSAASMASTVPSPLTSPNGPGGVDVGAGSVVLVGTDVAVSLGTGEGGTGSVATGVAVTLGTGEGGTGSVATGVAVTLGNGEGGIGSVGGVGTPPPTMIVPRIRPGWMLH